jgi:hypothetical protein
MPASGPGCRRRAVACASSNAAAAVLVLLPLTSQADADIRPVAITQYEWTSVSTGPTGNSFDNNLLRLAAGFESVYSVRQQRLFLDALYGNVSNGEDIDFGNDEYRLRTGIDWQAGRRLRGQAEAYGFKQVPSVPNVLVAGGGVQEERRLTATAEADTAAERFAAFGDVIHRNLDSPIRNFADLGVRESSGRGGAEYRNPNGFAVGGEWTSTDGRFRGDPGAVDYTQRTAAGTLRYRRPESFAIDAEVGRTERDQSGEPEPFKVRSGRIALEQVLTAKTAVNVQGTRRIDNFFGPDTATSAAISTWNTGVNWKATETLTVYVDYGQTRIEFLGATVAGPDLAGRKDRASTITVNLRSEARAWLTTELYLRIDDVSSNFEEYAFDGVLLGVKLLARKPPPDAP